MRKIRRLVQLAYSAEKAAAYAYHGHSNSVKSTSEKIEIKNIENEEWAHRQNLKRILDKIGCQASPWYELKYFLIGKFIGTSCHFIGWFMPMYFAGRLESGNVNEYVEMEKLALSHGLFDEIGCIKEMIRVEKLHENYFLDKAATNPVIKYFETIFRWGPNLSFNTYTLEPEGNAPSVLKQDVLPG